MGGVSKVYVELWRDGGWLTVDGLALEVGWSRESVKRTLSKLRDSGKVEARRVEGTGREAGWNEWRAVDVGIEL